MLELRLLQHKYEQSVMFSTANITFTRRSSASVTNTKFRRREKVKEKVNLKDTPIEAFEDNFTIRSNTNGSVWT